MIFFVIREEFKLRDFVQFYPCLKQVPRYIIFHSFVKIQETFLSNAERRFHVQLEPPDGSWFATSRLLLKYTRF